MHTAKRGVAADPDFKRMTEQPPQALCVGLKSAGVPAWLSATRRRGRRPRGRILGVAFTGEVKLQALAGLVRIEEDDRENARRQQESTRDGQ